MNRIRLPIEANGHSFPQETAEVIPDRLLPWAETFDCTMCGLRPMTQQGDNPELQITEESVTVLKPCPYPQGIITETVVSFPSGKIIVTDDLRPVYDVRSGHLTLNSAIGQAQLTKAMAGLECAYGGVSNTSPGLYRTDPDKYIIASDHDEEERESSQYEQLAVIYTDLWAYSIADYEDWQNKGGHPRKVRGHFTVVDITSGKYKFVYHAGERDFDPHGEGLVIFAHIERISS